MKKIATIVAIISLFVSGVAFAQTSTASSTAPISLTIGRNGKVKMEGSVASISGSALTVSSWGGSWSVNISSASLIRNFGGKMNSSELHQGDFVIVWGTASQTGQTVTATKIQDKSVQEKYAISGTISNLNATAQTFTLTTSKGQAFSVTMDQTNKIYVNRGSATFANLAEGMRAQVHGSVDKNQSTIAADWVKAYTSKPTGVSQPVTTSTSTSQ